MTTNGHGLIFTSHAHQKLNKKDRQVQKRATEYNRLDEMGMTIWMSGMECGKSKKKKGRETEKDKKVSSMYIYNYEKTQQG